MKNTFLYGTPLIIAATRGVFTAVLLGAAAALAMWSQTDAAKEIIIAGATPFIGTLLLRFGVEGAIDHNQVSMKE